MAGESCFPPLWPLGLGPGKHGTGLSTLACCCYEASWGSCQCFGARPHDISVTQVSCYYQAIAEIPLATLTLISRLHPLLSTALAGLVLGQLSATHCPKAEGEPLPRQQLFLLLVASLGTALLAPSEECFR